MFLAAGVLVVATRVGRVVAAPERDPAWCNGVDAALLPLGVSGWIAFRSQCRSHLAMAAASESSRVCPVRLARLPKCLAVYP